MDELDLKPAVWAAEEFAVVSNKVNITKNLEDPEFP